MDQSLPSSTTRRERRRYTELHKKLAEAKIVSKPKILLNELKIWTEHFRFQKINSIQPNILVQSNQTPIFQIASAYTYSIFLVGLVF